MELGAFSVSLTVKDLVTSKEFYEKLGFEVFGGTESQNYLMMRSGTTIIGLFQGMFDTNTLTFNPGWDHEMKTPDDWADVREIQRVFKERGVELQLEADESGTGPAHIFLLDPDGNPILIDQHI